MTKKLQQLTDKHTLLFKQELACLENVLQPMYKAEQLEATIKRIDQGIDKTINFCVLFLWIVIFASIVGVIYFGSEDWILLLVLQICILIGQACIQMRSKWYAKEKEILFPTRIAEIQRLKNEVLVLRENKAKSNQALLVSQVKTANKKQEITDYLHQLPEVLEKNYALLNFDAIPETERSEFKELLDAILEMHRRSLIQNISITNNKTTLWHHMNFICYGV